MSTTFGLFNTSVMGMAAQSDALANISENISNSSTVGYKDATTHFLTVLGGFQGADQFGGGVTTKGRYNVTAQGALLHTSSATDIAIKGGGFFVVSDGSGATFLTRAGSFAPDAQGRLVNAAGYYLMGFPAGAAPSAAATSALSSMSVVQMRTDRLFSNPTTAGALSANLPASAPITPAATLPSTNGAGASFAAKTSLTVYDNLGGSVILDIYYAKTAANTWETTVYDSAGAAPGGGFPYAAGPISTQTLTFNPANGGMMSGSPLGFTVPGGGAMQLDMSNTTQLGAPFVVNSATVNGNGAGAIRQIQISSNGAVGYLLDNGQVVPAYMISLANVNSPTNLSNYTGNVYAANGDSGTVFIGSPGAGGFGAVASSTLESSTVDLATELSSMIIAQRAYTANTQSFQVASEILQVLNNLK